MSEQITTANGPEQLDQTPRMMLDVLRSENERLSTELDVCVQQRQYPDWWKTGDLVQTSEIREKLREGGSPDEIAEFCVLQEERRKNRLIITGFEAIDTINSESYPGGIGVDAIAEAMRGSSKYAEQVRQEVMGEFSRPLAMVQNQLKVLKSYYQTESVTELLGIRGNGFDASVMAALRTNSAIEWMRFSDQTRKVGEQRSETQAHNLEWMAQAITTVSGLPEEEARQYAFSASRVSGNQSIVKILGHFDTFGADRIKIITQATNIYGLEGYSTGQLQRMERFAIDPKALARDLEKRDVKLVVINRSGDDGDVLKTVAEVVEGDEAVKGDEHVGTALFFEINNLSDIFRPWIKLRKVGIKPSTLWFAAHSAPGQFIVSDRRSMASRKRDIAAVATRALIKHANKSDEIIEANDYGYSLHGMKGFARLVDEYMRPSRGIDDPADAVGRKRIVFQACHMGSKVNVRDIDATGKRVTIGKESVITQVAKDLLQEGVASNVDIFGAPGGIQMHATERGVRYSGSRLAFGALRTALKGMRVRIDERRKPIVTRLEKIDLRRAA